MIAARAAHVRCDAASGRCEAEACGGFYLLRSKDARYGAHDGPHYGARDGAARASAFLEAMFARMAWQREHVDERLGEQPALNYALRRTAGLRYALLERASTRTAMPSSYGASGPRGVRATSCSCTTTGSRAMRPRFIQLP